MYIKKITLNNFRNYEKEEVEFEDNINIIYGNNAQGKTNIIEAIYLCAYGKSFRAKKESDLIRFNEKEANSEIEFFKVDRDSKISFNINEQKTFFINGIKQNKISDIIGRINVIIFTRGVKNADCSYGFRHSRLRRCRVNPQKQKYYRFKKRSKLS